MNMLLPLLLLLWLQSKDEEEDKGKENKEDEKPDTEEKVRLDFLDQVVKHWGGARVLSAIE